MALPNTRPARRLSLFVLGGFCLLTAACGTVGAQVRTLPDSAAAEGPAATVSASPGPATPQLSAAQSAAPAPDVIDPAAGVPQAVEQAGDGVNAPATVGADTQMSEAVSADAGWSRAAPETDGQTAAQPAAPAPLQAAAGAATQPAQTYRGVATYYGWDFQGRPMAAGPIFNMLDPTVTASNFWPLGTRLRIWRVAGGPWDTLLSTDQRGYYFSHSIIVTVLDRGAFTHALDLSYGAFAMLGNPPEGVIAVMIQPLDGARPSWQLGGVFGGS